MGEPAWPPSRREVLTGWGRTAPSAADVTRPHTADDAAVVVRRHDARGVVARGLARSYGDAAQNAGGSVVTTTELDRVIEVDVGAGVVTCEAGVSLDILMRRLLPLGWFVPVTPGTRQVTVGGAIAADIHGKNHHRDGSFVDHVLSLDLLGPDGEVRTVSPAADPDAFWATAGGMGLTGIAVRATIRLLPVTTSSVRVDTERAGDLDDLMARLVDGDRFRYSVAWIDCLARGRRLGRGIITNAEHVDVADLARSAQRDPLAFDPPTVAKAPPWVPSGLLRPVTAAAFNELWFRRAPRHREGEHQGLAWFFHPLDLVDDWNRIYGRHGLLQYQFVVPFGREDMVRVAIERLSAAGAASFLAVLKRFGAGNPGPLSFPRPGWTLALDMPATVAGLGALLDGLDELVVEAEGAVYLAKDSRLRPELLPAMYPRLDEWRTVRSRLDPDGVFRSDLARRLRIS